MGRQGFHLIETSKSKTKPFEVAKELEEKLMKLKLTLEVLVKEDEAFENKENNLETTSRRLIRKIPQVGI